MNDCVSRLCNCLLVIGIFTLNRAHGNNVTVPSNNSMNATFSISSQSNYTTTLPESTMETTSNTIGGLENEKSSNIVIIKFYNLLISKFEEEEYSKIVAETVTAFCAKQRCGSLSTNVSFTPEDVIVSGIAQDSKDLAVPTVVVYSAYGIPKTVLPKSILSRVLISNRDEFREAIGRDIIGVNERRFHINADVLSNAVISVVFSAITVILLIVTVLIRSNYARRDNEDRKQLLLAKLRRKENDDKTYKVRPGPEPIERYPSTKKKSVHLDSAAASHRIESNTNSNALDQQQSNQRAPQQYLTVGNRPAIAPETPAVTYHHESPAGFNGPPKLPPLDESEEALRRHEKKKREKKKKRKHRYHEEGEPNVPVQAHSNPTYDDE